MLKVLTFSCYLPKFSKVQGIDGLKPGFCLVMINPSLKAGVKVAIDDKGLQCYWLYGSI